MTKRPKRGRRRGLRVTTCVCGKRVTSTGAKQVTCVCGKRVTIGRGRSREQSINEGYLETP